MYACTLKCVTALMHLHAEALAYVTFRCAYSHSHSHLALQKSSCVLNCMMPSILHTSTSNRISLKQVPHELTRLDDENTVNSTNINIYVQTESEF